MRKRILSALLAVMFLFTGLPGTAWAVGEGNMEAGGGQTETVTGDSFWNGQWGIRFCVVDVVSQSVVSATYDASNYGGLSNYWHYGKTNKFDYRNGATLTIRQGNYTLETPAVTIPTIVRTSGAPDIKAIKDYFTDETVIRWIGDVTGMAYDTLISGDYKLFIEPILYYTFDSQKYAMTATEAALFDRAINGLLLRTMGNATHQQLPLSLYLEKSDLGFSKWSGAKTGIQNDTNIINYLGMGIVSFIPEEEPEPGTGGNGDGPTVPISFRKTDPERFNAANYNTGLITFAPASSNSAAFDNISGAVIEISGNGTGAGTYELPCTVELGEGTFTVREVTPPYGYLLNDAWSAEITVEVEKDGEGKPVEGAEAEATITVSGGGGTDGTSYASVEDYRQRGQLTVIGRVVNDAKVTDHHALLPTGEVTPERMDKLKGQQQDILKVVISSFGRATAENYEYTATEVLLDVEGEAFKAHGQMVRESGWRDFDTDLRRRLGIQQEEKDQEDLLPRLHEGEIYPVQAMHTAEKQTQPPKAYTEDTLLAAMEQAVKRIDDSGEIPDTAGLGTPATRAGIIESVIRSGYLRRTGKQILANDMGKTLVEVVTEELRQPDLTASWERSLSAIQAGTLAPETFMGEIKAFLRSHVEAVKLFHDPAEARDTFQRTERRRADMGICPCCGRIVRDYPKSYACEAVKDGECGFVIWKKIAGKEITPLQAQQLIAMGTTDLIKGFVSTRTGKKFDAKLVLDDNKETRFEFAQQTAKRR